MKLPKPRRSVCTRARLIAPLSLLLMASWRPALAMQPAVTSGGYEAGAEVGASFGRGTVLAAAGDVAWGIRTSFLNQPYTSIVADVLSVARSTPFPLPTGRLDVRANIITLGVRQPLPISDLLPIAVEGGYSYLNVNASSQSAAQNLNPSGGFIGGRATWGQAGPFSLTGMIRYHFEGSGFTQVGGGISGPLGYGTGATYQVDFYHTGGGRFGGFSGLTDTILAGIRWNGAF